MSISLLLGYWFIFYLGVIAGTRAKENNISLLHHAKIHSSHYSGVTWAWWRLKSPATRLFVYTSTYSTNKKENAKAPHHRPFLRRFNGEHGFSVTKDNSLSRRDDWVNRPYEMLLKSYHAYELKSFVAYIYCWYLICGQLFFSISSGWLTNSSCCCYLGWLTISSVYCQPCFYGVRTTCQFARWRWYNVVISYGLVSKSSKRETILLPYGWTSRP